jgi:hypothetical protein
MKFMKVEVISEPLELNIHGFSATAAGKDYTGTAFSLSGRMWQVVKAHGLKNEGKNILVYEDHDRVFAGVKLLEDTDAHVHGLEPKLIRLEQYAYHKHIGPYGLIRQAGQAMRKELDGMGLAVMLPYLEIYGHWDQDESRLETELIMCLK